MDTFLRKHRAEVTNVILREYNEERHIKNEKAISYQEGVEEGIKEGIKEGIHAVIELCSEMNHTPEQICITLMQKFSLTKEQASDCLKKYYEEAK